MPLARWPQDAMPTHDMSPHAEINFKLHITGGGLDLAVHIPDPCLTIGWLKIEFKTLAEQRGKQLTVHEFSYNGYLVDDLDAISDVLQDQSHLLAMGPGIEPPAPPRQHASGGGGSGGAASAEEMRTKRKYARGGHKKMKIVAHVLEAFLPEMMQTPEKERQKFYAKVRVGPPSPQQLAGGRLSLARVLPAASRRQRQRPAHHCPALAAAPAARLPDSDRRPLSRRATLADGGAPPNGGQ